LASGEKRRIPLSVHPALEIFVIQGDDIMWMCHQARKTVAVVVKNRVEGVVARGGGEERVKTTGKNQNPMIL
jgi:isopentenyl phosphate kinase